MSYDLEVWSAEPTTRTALGTRRGWQEQKGIWTLALGKGQLVVNHPGPVLPEDLPPEVADRLSDARYFTQINLEASRTNTNVRLAQQVATRIAVACQGIVVDQQEGSVWSPFDIKQFPEPKPKGRFSTLSLSWWFIDSPLLSRDGRRQLLDLLQQVLPEALPRRYGLYEPPPFRFAEMGREHFLQTFDEELARGFGHVIWDPHSPILGFELGIVGPGFRKPGFAAHKLGLEVDKALLTEPGWQERLRHAWKALSWLARPIYGDVRTLGGRIRKRGGYWLDGHTEAHPVSGYSFRGIPTSASHAVVLGPAYQQLWPEFKATASCEEGLAFASISDWSQAEDLSVLIGAVPSAIAAPESTNAPPGFGGPFSLEDYPAKWPFGKGPS